MKAEGKDASGKPVAITRGRQAREHRRLHQAVPRHLDAGRAEGRVHGHAQLAAGFASLSLWPRSCRGSFFSHRRLRPLQHPQLGAGADLQPDLLADQHHVADAELGAPAALLEVQRHAGFLIHEGGPRTRLYEIRKQGRAVVARPLLRTARQVRRSLGLRAGRVSKADSLRSRNAGAAIHPRVFGPCVRVVGVSWTF